MEKPKYSICMPNFNMSDTLERSLDSVCMQIDDEFEVVIVDDGSTDDSLITIERMSKKYSSIRYFALESNRRRQLGETRNICIRKACGDYVLLHIDADDVWEPYLKDFIKVFHRIERCLGKDVLLAGQQVNMAKRSFLLEHGPYRNGFCEDRDMWHRLAAIDSYIPLEHRIFRTRLERTTKIRYTKAMRKMWNHMTYDMRRGFANKQYILNILLGVFTHSTNNRSIMQRIIRTGMVLPAYAVSKLREPLPAPQNMPSHAEFVKYRETVKGTYEEIMQRFGCDPDLSFLDDDAQRIFRQRPGG